MMTAGAPAVWQSNVDPVVNLRFLDILPETRYISHVLTGLTADHTLAVDQRTSVEVFVKKGSKLANLVPVTPELPVNLLAMQQYAKMVRYSAGPMLGNANGFTDFFKKLPHFASRVPGVLGRVAGDVLADLPSRVYREFKDEFGRASSFAHGVPIAAGFGAGARAPRTTFSFPVVYPDNSTKILEITDGAGHAPDFVYDVAARQINCSTPYVGTSDGLAFLMASLGTRRWPVRPGMYSGEVDNVSFDGATITFDLKPIAMGKLKSRGNREPHEVVVTPNGVLDEEGFSRPLSRNDLFKNSYPVIVQIRPRTFDDYPGHGYHITAVYAPR
jgi:hypothetical protein